MVDHGGSITEQLVTPLLQGDRTNPNPMAVHLKVFALGINGKMLERA